MGQGLPRAVSSVVVKRHGGALFRVGFAEMNGWRPAMEDAHVIFMQEAWGFFGVFDGHGGDQCSTFIARRFNEELEKGAPSNDAAMKALALRLDEEFLMTGQPSGSTGTFVLVQPPAGDESQYTLRVGNIGDSRILLGRADGTIVEGNGTDGGLTTDHKPDHPSERERIERTGGTVQEVQGVARVNGDLAVSRAFGDAQYKQTGGPGQEDHPVTAEPEMLTLRCDPSDFVVLVCDGISEGNFPNRAVIVHAAEELRAGGDNPDPGAAAASVCRKALASESQDNLSCMIVMLGGGEVRGPSRELLPGPFTEPKHKGFRKAYAAMAAHVDLTLAAAVEKRYDCAREERDKLVELSEGDAPGDQDGQDGNCKAESELPALRTEIAAFGDGPPSTLEPGSVERVQWFSDWLDAQGGDDDGEGNASVTQEQFLDLLELNPRLMAMAQARGLAVRNRRTVRVAPMEQLKPAMEAHPALKWANELEQVCGTEGTVIKDDHSDGTSQVQFKTFSAWMPQSMLTDIKGRTVEVAQLEQLRPAIEKHPDLRWNDQVARFAGQRGVVLQDDPSDGTSKVQFESPETTTAWLPTDMLTTVEGGDDDEDAKRRRTD
mmetsp:Transcript_76960/g.213886  ORF Transcript_76960/g.213886 Transcript_76960/m.213886 type:complete len:603 (+) Transcript_76960:76-1884(+)|eukprot:CAMPEP_0117577698 /NCGR_PEP_ID=MMETSP0784-20121206/63568_1 /TAXON_ID=39447 /ORGANISM="" /LENGTH=602 /DNA_ID=CAMNT_0005377231 /DNA_START=41 /DNA_END=1849 /DNA_ORIENTATION=-